MLLFERLTDILAPHNCLSCDSEGALLCAQCLPEICIPPPPRCFRCHAATVDSAVCAKCRRQAPLGHVWLASEYGGATKQLLHCFKFERAKAAADPASRALEAALPYFDERVVFTHIPAATSRVRQRGYDQSALLAKSLARSLGRRHVTLLSRYGQSRQVGAKREQRLRQLEGAFQPRQQAIIKGAHILLIDDVVTTGATLVAAATALKAAGAKKVDAAVLAQA